VPDKRHDSLWSHFSGHPRGDVSTAETPIATVEEACMGCGQETAVGSIFFSDRREVQIANGTRVYLCSECQSKAHLARKGQPLTDDDLRTIAGNGAMIGVGFLGGGAAF
jgi:pyruvate/2-oxoacid:ferredoxin oxidoreductase beta subunit